ncbi:MAG: hypothetical protein GY909_14575 [Oligoflexia bacterium]|nr:hypothetical protein [Oligoflexia bacterium]
MKTILIIFVGLFISLSSMAEEKKVVNCRDAKDDVRTFCNVLNKQCMRIKNCMVRRDSCLDGIPKTKSECDRVNKCVNNLNYEFDDTEMCEYRWIIHNGESNCRVRDKWYTIKEACPGRIKGLLNTVAVGIDATVDQDFDCDAVNKTYVKDKKFCTDAMKEFEGSCIKSDEDRNFLKDYYSYKCVYHEKFSNYKKGHFAVSDLSQESTSINDSNSRGSDKKNHNSQGQDLGSGVYSR